MGREFSVYGKEQRHIEGFGGETCGKEFQHSWEDNIKMDLQEVECGVWIGSSW
jgi:hypothetical protein